MKKLHLIFYLMIFGSIVTFSQNEEVLTLSKGRYNEIPTYNKYERIGSVIMDMETKTIAGFVDRDTMLLSAINEPDVTSRWFVIDAFAEKYLSMSPYNYAANNPILFIDVNGDSLNVAQLQEFNSDASSALVSDLHTKSGLTLTPDANGNVSYAKDKKGKAIVTRVDGKKIGSRAARKALTKLIDSESMVSVAGSNTLSTRVDMDGPDPNLIIFNPEQTQDAMNNRSSDLNNTTKGWALTFFHEIGHTEYGGTGYDPSTGPANGPAQQQDGFETAGRQEILPNRIRRQLGSEYGQRVTYNSYPVMSAGQNYFPWSQKSLRQLKAGNAPAQKYIIQPWGK